MRHCLEQIVVVMCEKGLADDLRLSEIQDHLSIAGFDVPLRSYDTRGAVQAERQRAPNIPAGVTAYLDWKASGDSSPSNLVHAILQAVRDSLGGNPK